MQGKTQVGLQGGEKYGVMFFTVQTYNQSTSHTIICPRFMPPNLSTSLKVTVWLMRTYVIILIERIVRNVKL